MRRSGAIKALTGLGYAGLAGCGVPLWWHMAATGDASGVSVWFLALYTASLALLQAGLVLGRLGRALVWGNAAGLANVLIALAVYLWIQGGGA